MESKKISELEQYNGSADGFVIPGVADGETQKANLGTLVEQKVEAAGFLKPSGLKTINGESVVGSGNVDIDMKNPFKGYYPSGVSKPDTGAVGDYIYAPPSDQTSSATATIWHYDNTQTPPWTDTGIDVSAFVGVEFGSGQSVPATKIKDENGEEVTGPAGVLSAEAGLRLKEGQNGLNDDMYGRDVEEFVDGGFTIQYTGNRFISSGGVWSSTGNSDNACKILAVTPGSRIKVENTGAYGGFYAILKSSYTQLNDAVDFANGWTSRQVLEGHNSVIIDVPSDGNYLYMSTSASGYVVSIDAKLWQIVHKDGVLEKVEDIPNVYNGLDSDSTTDALSAGQGKVLKNMVNDLATDIFGGDKNVQVVGSLNLSVGKTGTRAYFPNGYQYGTSPYIQKSYYYQVDVFESYDNTYLRVYAGQHTCYVTLLQTTSGLDAESTPSYASVMAGNTRIIIAANSFADIVLASDCKYLVFYNKDNTGDGSVDGYYMPSKVEYITKEVVDPIISTSKISITHLVPDNEGQLNAVRRMRKLTDVKWTPSFDFGRMSGGFGKAFGDTFLEGVEYTGIPYSRAYLNNGTYGSYDYGYPGDTGFKIGFRISLETFVTCVYNKGTVVEKESNYNSSLHCSSFYANICAGAVSAALGKDYLMTNNFDNGLDTGAPTGFTNIGRISDDFDLTLLKLGDAIAKKDVHTAMITDVIKNNAGEIEYIEISESNAVGGNPNLVGAKLGGTTRRVWWNLSELHRVWNGYKVLRSTNIESLTYTPSPYSPMPDENYIYAQYYMACLPYMGNKFRYVYNKMPDRMRKLVVQAKGISKLHILKENNGVYEDFLITDVPAFSTGTGEGEGYDYVYIVLPDYNDPSTPMTTGNYKAYLCNISGGSEIDKTSSCEWSVVDAITKLADY